MSSSSPNSLAASESESVPAALAEESAAIDEDPLEACKRNG